MKALKLVAALVLVVNTAWAVESAEVYNDFRTSENISAEAAGFDADADFDVDALVAENANKDVFGSLLDSFENNNDGMAEINNIFGPDSRRVIQNYTNPIRRLVRIKIPGSYCSGALINRKLVLTAAHCILRDGKLVNNIEVFTEYYKGSYRSRSWAMWAQWGTSNPNSNRKADWALLILKHNLGNQQGWLGVQGKTSRSERNGMRMGGFSYDVQGGNVLSYTNGCKIQRFFNDGIMYHDCDAARGSSGASMFKCNSKGCYVYGLNVAEFRNGGEKSLRVDRYRQKYANIAINPQVFIKYVKAAIQKQSQYN